MHAQAGKDKRRLQVEMDRLLHQLQYRSVAHLPSRSLLTPIPYRLAGTIPEPPPSQQHSDDVIAVLQQALQPPPAGAFDNRYQWGPEQGNKGE